MKRILAIDLGIKKSGIAISDPMQIISQPLKLIRYEANDYLTLIQELEKTILENKPIDYLVLGLPISDKKSNIMFKNVMEFKKLLENSFEYNVVLEDERFSSQTASKRMIEMNLKIKDKKEARDIFAAQFILENHLSKKK